MCTFAPAVNGKVRYSHALTRLCGFKGPLDNAHRLQPPLVASCLTGLMPCCLSGAVQPREPSWQAGVPRPHRFVQLFF